jgi:hypothetical protein
MHPLKGGWSNYSSPNRLTHLARNSIAILNRKGDIGSPWRTPRFNWTDLPATEFSIICVLPCNNNSLIHLVIYSENPDASRHFIKNEHSTELKALYISALKTAIFLFCLVAAVIASYAYTKPCIMYLPFKNYVCVSLKNLSIYNWNLLPRTLENNFYTLLIRLIRQKSPGLHAWSDFDIRTM